MVGAHTRRFFNVLAGGLVEARQRAAGEAAEDRACGFMSNNALGPGQPAASCAAAASAKFCNVLEVCPTLGLLANSFIFLLVVLLLVRVLTVVLLVVARRAGRRHVCVLRSSNFETIWDGCE